MWPTIIPGLFALGGTALGVLLEPLKGLFSSRARTRQLRGERCADVLRAATTIHRDLLDLNGQYRATQARQASMSPEQLTELVRELNQARTDLRLAAALIRLHGPDDLADMADKVVVAEHAMYLLAKVDGPDPFQLLSVPAKLVEAGERLDAEAAAFAKAARSSTQ